MGSNPTPSAENRHFPLTRADPWTADYPSYYPNGNGAARVASCGGCWLGSTPNPPGRAATPVGRRVAAWATTALGAAGMRRSPRSYPRPLTARECATLERLARGMTQKMIAFEFGISINTVGNIAANAYRKLGVHSAAAAVHAHRDAHFLCGSRVDFGPVRDRIRASSRLPAG